MLGRMSNGASATYTQSPVTRKKWRGRSYVSLLLFIIDNGAMIAYAGALRLAAGQRDPDEAEVRPRWPMTLLHPPEVA